MSRTIAFVLYPGFVALDVAGPLDVFQAATSLGQGGQSAYDFAFVGVPPGLVSATSGLAMLADTAAEACRPHTVVVPGGPDVARAADDARLLGTITSLAARARRVVSVCSGAWLLAACGLLSGRRATTHWMVAEAMAARFPEVSVTADAIAVRDGHVVTSAGVTAGIDLALALVEEDLGPERALAVARLLVVYRRRPGHQSQFSEPLRVEAMVGTRFAALHDWVQAHLAEDLGVERLADRAGLSPRHFARLFRAKTGIGPGRYVERLRLERARELIESGEGHMQTVADWAGFGSEERLRRVFQRRLGITPNLYLSHFSKERLRSAS